MRLPLGGVFSAPAHYALQLRDFLIPVIIPKVQHGNHQLAYKIGIQADTAAVITEVPATEVRHRCALTLSLCLYGVL